jgi:hypothetical protein
MRFCEVPMQEDFFAHPSKKVNFDFNIPTAFGNTFMEVDRPSKVHIWFP